MSTEERKKIFAARGFELRTFNLALPLDPPLALTPNIANPITKEEFFN